MGVFPFEDRLLVFGSDGSRHPLDEGAWLDTHLPEELDEVRNDAGRLRALIELGLEDGSSQGIVSAARRLTELEPGDERSALLLSKALSSLHDEEAAERVLEQHIAAFGDSARILASLAHARWNEGKRSEALGLLRRSLAQDPNDRTSLEFWTQVHGGPSGDLDAIEPCLVEIAREPGAWRPQLLLGKLALTLGEDAIAIDCFRSVLARSEGNQSALHSVAYTLVDADRIDELVALLAPHEAPNGEDTTDPDVMRIFERLRRGRAIVDDLLERELPLLAHHFDEIGTALEAEEDEDEPDAEGQLVMEFGTKTAGSQTRVEGSGEHAHDLAAAPATLTSEGLSTFSYRAPLFGVLLREALALLPPKQAGSPRITFFGASVDLDPATEKVASPSEEARFALLPALLAESTALGTNARAYCCLPYLEGEGLVARETPFEPSELFEAGSPDQPDYLVSCHATRAKGELAIEVKVFDMRAACAVARLKRPAADSSIASLRDIALRVVALLEELPELELARPESLEIPSETDARGLEALRELLDLALVEMDIPPRQHLPGQIRCEQLLELTSAAPEDVWTRLAVLAGVVAARETDGEMTESVRTRVRELLAIPGEDEALAGESLAARFPELAVRLERV